MGAVSKPHWELSQYYQDTCWGNLFGQSYFWKHFKQDRCSIGRCNGRRYFYPLITEFAVYKKKMKQKKSNFNFAKQKSERVICLPIYSNLNIKIVKKVIEEVNMK